MSFKYIYISKFAINYTVYTTFLWITLDVKKKKKQLRETLL